MSKDDMKKMFIKFKRDIYDLEKKLHEEQEKTALWQRISFFSWILTMIALAMQVLSNK